MSKIILATINAKYIHTAFGLRYLLANMGPLRSQTCLMEFDLDQRPVEIATALLASEPQIVGLGIYVWNVALATELVDILKRVRPGLTIILGGPEVSFETESQAIVQNADYVITGEADLKFSEVCRQLLEGRVPSSKVIAAEPPDLHTVALPYELYEDRDLLQRVIYVETSRGCPYSCDFCLSSLDSAVRQFPLSDVLNCFERMMERGARHFKFVDRTFNLSLPAAQTVLSFFRERQQPGLGLHFEMVPDRFPEELRNTVSLFAPGTLQFEVGIQTFNPSVAERIRRRQDYDRIEDNLRFLRARTGVHLHTDLIAGLPGENLESFGEGFDRLVALRPQEIQVGLLKRLRGAPISRHDAEWEMVYNPHPPYEILQNKALDFSQVQKLRQFARVWDLVANSGNFVETAPLLWAGGESAFGGFMKWCEWLRGEAGRAHGIALTRLFEFLFRYLVQQTGMIPEHVAPILWRDYQRGGRNDLPVFLRQYLPEASPAKSAERHMGALKRQARHGS